MIDKDTLLKIIYGIADTIEKNKEFLTQLDSAIGDSDHGINMNKGFKAVKEKLKAVEDKDCGTILKTVAMTLISTVGGASGPLYGTAFLKASLVVNGKMEVNKEDAIKMFDEAIKGIMSRGKAQKGEKTMLDALIPAFQALKESTDSGDSLTETAVKCKQAALDGVEFTKKIIATKGRASYLGERSLGHQDPGATSSYLMLEVISNVLKDN